MFFDNMHKMFFYSLVFLSPQYIFVLMCFAIYFLVLMFEINYVLKDDVLNYVLVVVMVLF